MATLEVNLNCMCLFVPDPQPGSTTGAVHVLMPCTHRYARADLHVVRMDYVDAQGQRVVAELEGWALELGDRAAPRASVQLALPDGGRADQIPNLTHLTRDTADPIGRRVPRSMIEGRHHEVISRISFYDGAISAIESQWPQWLLNDTQVALAHLVTWRLQVSDPQIVWKRLDGSSQPAPLPSLGAIRPDDVGGVPVHRVNVHHIAKKALEDGNGNDNTFPFPNALDEADIRSHFRMFYLLLGEEPADAQLPQIPPEIRLLINSPDFGGSRGYACKAAQAEPDPVIV